MENVNIMQIALLGDKFVGKTSFIKALNSFIDDIYVPTIQYNIFNYFTKVNMNNGKKEKPFNVILWDFGDGVKY